MNAPAMHARRELRLMIRDDGVIAHSTPGVLANPRFRPYEGETMDRIKEQLGITNSHTKPTATVKPVEQPIQEKPVPKVDLECMDTSLMSREQLIAYGEKIGLSMDKRLKTGDLLLYVNAAVSKA